MKKIQMSSRKMITTFAQITTLGLVFNPLAYAEDQWKLTLKNAFIERDFQNEAVKDNGSWSQGVSLFYNSDYKSLPIDQLEIGLDASVQYAYRLSEDKHVADSILPFDVQTQSQARDYIKYGGTVKLKYQDNVIRVGELWLDLPVTAVDASRQLLTSYLGANINSKVNDKLTIEAGRVAKVSPRNVEGFDKFSYTSNGTKYTSDGLNYVDLRYQFNDHSKAEYYFGNLESLFNTHYLGLEHIYKVNEDAKIISKLKYFNAKNDKKQLDIDSQNIGFLETLKYQNHSFGLGYQKIIGDTYPLPDGYLPQTYFVNWNVTGFFKAKEESFHLIYAYDFKDTIPGLNTTIKYSYGDNIKMAGGQKNKESEWDFIWGYNFQQPVLKGFGVQYLFAKYDVDYGESFNENRVFLTYSKNF